jgi:ferric-dicitrate binding protein FerR (iron transport regulator)
MENTNHDETLLARWLADELTEQELAELQQREDYADLQTIVEGMKGLEMPAFSEQACWEKLQERLKAEQPKATNEEPPIPVISEGEILPPEVKTPEMEAPTVKIDQPQTPPPATHTSLPSPVLKPVTETPIRSINRRQWLYAAAAAVAILLVSLFMLKKSDPASGYDTVVSSDKGEQKSVTLPDGTTVQLNAASLVGYTESDWPDDREVYLQGEAYFKAAKGKTFTVLTDQGKVQVVGTMFNVFAREQQLEVKCTEGIVQVFNPKETEKVLLKAGEQVSVTNGRMQKRAGIDFTPKWFKGESVFKSAPRSRVFREIERQFNVTVVVEDWKGSPFSGKFVNNDLEKALKMVAVPMGLKYEIKNDSVWFSPK